MNNINNFTYPVLNLFGYENIWEHPMFSAFLREATPEEMARVAATRGVTFKDDDRVFLPIGDMSAERRLMWPAFALTPEDFFTFDREGLISFDEALATCWRHHFHDVVPEVIPLDVWDKAFDHDIDGFERWVRNITVGTAFRGVMVRADEEVATMYSFLFGEGSVAVYVHTMLHNFSIGVSYNHDVFLSRNIEVPDEVLAMARRYGHTAEEEFLLAEQRCIMKYIYYKNSGQTEQALLHRGESAFSGGTEYKSATDTPVFFISNKQ